MRPFALLGLLLLLVTSIHAQDDSTSEDVPYIYYYSNVLKGIVIERADGTDSRVLGRGLVSENAGWVRGPGWSADGSWFAWRTETYEGRTYPTILNGYAVHIDGEQVINLDRFSCVHHMYWHPTRNILLVHGEIKGRDEICGQSAYLATFWLMDVDEQRLLATFSVNQSSDHSDFPLIYWIPHEQRVMISVVVEDYHYRLLDFLVSMYFDGRVYTEPVSREERDAALAVLSADASEMPNQDFGYTNWDLYPEERITGVPSAVDFRGPTVAGLWHPSQEWLLVGHEFCFAGCAGVIGAMSIFHPETESYREISDCGGHPSCVGWLPDRVNIEAMSPGRPTSVLPAPMTIEYRARLENTRYFPEGMTHEIMCHAGRYQHLRNVETDEIDFVLPVSEPCVPRATTDMDYTRVVVFALSPDGVYFAMTDKTRYTSLYDVLTGERIVTLNFLGHELSFSEDSRYLTTASSTAIATWDIQDLITNHSD